MTDSELVWCATCGAAEPKPIPGWPPPKPHLVIRGAKVCRPCARLIRSKINALEPEECGNNPNQGA